MPVQKQRERIPLRLLAPVQQVPFPREVLVWGKSVTALGRPDPDCEPEHRVRRGHQLEYVCSYNQIFRMVLTLFLSNQCRHRLSIPTQVTIRTAEW